MKLNNLTYVGLHCITALQMKRQDVPADCVSQFRLNLELGKDHQGDFVLDREKDTKLFLHLNINNTEESNNSLPH